MSNERKPLLSDHDLMSMMFFTEDGTRPSEKVREFYEDLITDGKLRVVEEVELIQAEPLVPMWFCSHCDWRNAPSHYTFCPGCGNKIKLTKQ